MKTLSLTLAILMPLSSWGIVLHQEDSSIRPQGEQIYYETKERIEVPDEELKSVPKYSMGKDPIPVTIADVVRIASEHFQKTLGLPFSEQSGFVNVNLSWTGSLGNPVWYYLASLRPYDKSKLKEPERWDYKLAILMNGRLYPAVTSIKELVDKSDPVRESGIPFLQNRKRGELHLLEKEMSRLRKLPNVRSNEHAGVYLHSKDASAYIFYPDGCLFSIHTVGTDLYKVDDQGRVFTTYVYGPKNDKMGGDTYIGVFRDGKFIADQGDYQDIYLLKEMPTPKPEESKKASPKKK